MGRQEWFPSINVEGKHDSHEVLNAESNYDYQQYKTWR